RERKQVAHVAGQGREVAPVGRAADAHGGCRWMFALRDLHRLEAAETDAEDSDRSGIAPGHQQRPARGRYKVVEPGQSQTTLGARLSLSGAVDEHAAEAAVAEQDAGELPQFDLLDRVEAVDEYDRRRRRVSRGAAFEQVGRAGAGLELQL